MALVRSKTADTPGATFSRQGSNIGQYDAPDAVRPQLKNTSTLKTLADKAASKSDGSFGSDDMKYVIATKTAQDRFRDVGGVDDNRMKQEIDSILEDELGAEKGTGRRIRGENGFTDFIGGLNNGIKGINNAVGGLLDAGFDGIIGGLAELFGGHEAGESVRNITTGEDLSLVPDIAEDILLGMIPGAGIPLVLAKNAIQQSDNIAEAISGRDNITQDDLGGWERFGKGAEATLATALAAVPAIGKTKNMVSFAKDSKKGIQEGVEDIVENPLNYQGVADSLLTEATKNPTKNPEIVGEIFKNISKGEAKPSTAAKNVLDAVESGTGEKSPVSLALKNILNNNSDDVVKAASKAPTTPAKENAIRITDGLAKRVDKEFGPSSPISKAVNGILDTKAPEESVVSSAINTIKKNIPAKEEVGDKARKFFLGDKVKPVDKTEHGIYESLAKSDPTTFTGESGEKILERLAADNPEVLQASIDRVTDAYTKGMREAMKGPKYKERFAFYRDQAADSIKPIPRAEKQKIKTDIEKLQIEKRKAKKEGDVDKLEDLKKQIIARKDDLTAQRMHPIKAIRELKEGLIPNSKSTTYAKRMQADFDPTSFSGIKIAGREMPWFVNYGANVGKNGLMLGGAASAAEMGEGDVDPITALAEVTGRISNNPGAFATMLVPGLSRGLARRQASLRGKFGNDQAYRSVRAGAAADRISDLAEADIPESQNEDEIIRRLSLISEG